MRARRTDENHSATVKLLRDGGFSVLDLSGVGGGCPDLLICKDGVMHLVEIKNGKKVPSQRKLTPAQKEFHASWQGPIMVINSDAEILKFIRGK